MRKFTRVAEGIYRYHAGGSYLRSKVGGRPTWSKLKSADHRVVAFASMNKNPPLLLLALAGGAIAPRICLLSAACIRIFRPNGSRGKAAPTVLEVANFDVGKITLVAFPILFLDGVIYIMWSMFTL